MTNLNSFNLLDLQSKNSFKFVQLYVEFGYKGYPHVFYKVDLEIETDKTKHQYFSLLTIRHNIGFVFRIDFILKNI